MQNPKYIVEFQATKKLIVPAKSEQEAIDKAAKRVGAFWRNVAQAKPVENVVNL